jgi:sortase (surface protein transpeptidase)
VKRRVAAPVAGTALALSLAVLVAVPLTMADSDASSVGARPSWTGEVATAPTATSPAPRRLASPAPAAPAAPVAPDPAPVRVRVPAVGLDAPVRATGVTPDGLAEVPADARVLGWYRYGPAPGADAGSAVVVGHVDSLRQGKGALFKMLNVPLGSTIVVERDDAAPVTYRVVARELISKRRLPTEELFARDGRPRLTLITCGGDYDRQNGGYQDNVVVTAVPVTVPVTREGAGR